MTAAISGDSAAAISEAAAPFRRHGRNSSRADQWRGNHNHQFFDRGRAHGLSRVLGRYELLCLHQCHNNDHINGQPDNGCALWGADADSYSAVFGRRSARRHGHFHGRRRHGGHSPVTAGASGLGTATLAVSSATQTLGFTAGSDTITAAMAEIRSMALRPGPQPLR
jgi:hypothetical protein